MRRMSGNIAPGGPVVKSPLLAALAVVLLLLVSAPVRGAELLVNGGFESGTDGWSANFGVLDDVSSPVRSGSQAARLTSSALQSHEVSQSVGVAPGETYSFGGWVRADSPNLERAFLRISWFSSDGSLVSTEDSPWLTTPAGFYQWLHIGPVTSPSVAVRARVGIRAQGKGAFTLNLDDFSFAGAPQPAVTPAPPTPIPSGTATPKPTSAATPKATPRATPNPPSTPTPTGSVEPAVFDRLTNGGFEILRSDGTPYAWREFGAELSTAASPRSQGDRALALASGSASTKWAYQTVAVTGGAWYEANVDALAGGAQEAFLRLSWYESDDASGSAIGSVDSLASAGRGVSDFTRLSTGPVQAPAEAQTVRVRLMVRPGSEASTVTYFDSASLIESFPTGVPTTTETNNGRSVRSRGRAAGEPASVQLAATGQQHGESPAIGATPFSFVNVERVPSESQAPGGGAGPGYRWLAYVGLITGIITAGYTGAMELARRKRKDGE
jgi:hypothetical protein